MASALAKTSSLRMSNREKTTNEDVAKVANEFSPARDEMAVEYQILVAAREATSREMVPEQYRKLSPLELRKRATFFSWLLLIWKIVVHTKLLNHE